MSPRRRSVTGSLPFLASFAFVAFALVSLTAARPARAQSEAAPAGQPEAVPPPVPAAPPATHVVPLPTEPQPFDDVLRRLLRSGCRDGLGEARALAAGNTVPWAQTVARLCGEMLQRPERPVVVAPRPLSAERSGRGTMVFWSTAYGIWTGVAFDVLFSIDSVRGAILPPLAGMGLGLGLSLALTADHPLTNGEAWAIATGLEFGSFNGAMWAGGFKADSEGVVGTTLATGITAGAAGLLVAKELHPTQGDVEVVRSGLLWGTAAGMLTTAVIDPNIAFDSFWRASAVAMDLGFLGGVALAASFDVSRNRDLIIDAGTLGGGVAGGGIAILVMGSNGSGRAIAGGALAGMAVGMIATIYFTRDMDDDEDDERTPPVATLFGRDARGRWGVGTPSPAPVFDGVGHRVVGATFSALGGTF